jgi:hypothetical protein
MEEVVWSDYVWISGGNWGLRSAHVEEDIESRRRYLLIEMER